MIISFEGAERGFSPATLARTLKPRTKYPLPSILNLPSRQAVTINSDKFVSVDDRPGIRH